MGKKGKKRMAVAAAIIILAVFGTGFYVNPNKEFELCKMDDILICHGQQYHRQYLAEYDSNAGLLGKEIGSAMGNLEDLSDLESREDFTSVIKGSVYKVRDCSEEEWLCIWPEDLNEVINHECLLFYQADNSDKTTVPDVYLPTEIWTEEVGAVICHAFDVDDYSEWLHYSDFTFAGTVKELVKTEYEESDENYLKWNRSWWDATSVYKVEVLESLKGQLEPGAEILIYKRGGISREKDSYLVREPGDEVPKPGKTYMFSGYLTEDEKLFVGGKNSSIFLCNQEDNQEIKNNEIYLEFVKAVQNHNESF